MEALRDTATLLVNAGVRFHDGVNLYRRAYMEAALKTYHGNKCKTARAVGLHRNRINAQMNAMPGRKLG